MDASAQNPGKTKPTLEALVGNSSRIDIVRVKSFELDEKKRNLLRLELQVLKQLKRPWEMPTDKSAGATRKQADSETKQPADRVDSSRVTFTQANMVPLRYYDQSHWGLDFTAPLGNLGEHASQWRDQAAELMLFQDFETVEAGRQQWFVELGKDQVIQDDWTLLTDAKTIQEKVDELINRYRGIDRLRLVLVDVGHFTPAVLAMTGRTKLDLPDFYARCLYMPADAQYEKLLIEQIKHPQYMHDDGQPVMVYRVDWLRYTRDIYSFASERNEHLLRQLLADPKLGRQQKSLLEEILESWQTLPAKKPQ